MNLIRIMVTKMNNLAVLAGKKRQNFLKVRVGHGTCPRVPLTVSCVDIVQGFACHVCQMINFRYVRGFPVLHMEAGEEA